MVIHLLQPGNYYTFIRVVDFFHACAAITTFSQVVGFFHACIVKPLLTAIVLSLALMSLGWLVRSRFLPEPMSQSFVMPFVSEMVDASSREKRQKLIMVSGSAPRLHTPSLRHTKHTGWSTTMVVGSPFHRLSTRFRMGCC